MPPDPTAARRRNTEIQNLMKTALANEDALDPRTAANMAAARALPEAKHFQIVASLFAREGKSIEQISAILNGHIAAGNMVMRDDAPWRTDPSRRQVDIDRDHEHLAATGRAFSSPIRSRASADAWAEVIEETNNMNRIRR
jgi:hypothetical protein